MKSAADMSAAYQRGMANASANYVAGINSVTVNPMELAASDAAMTNYQNGVNRSVSSGKRRAKLLAANPATWKQNAVTVGASRLVSGAQKAKPKVDAHFQKWQPIYAQASAAAKALPKGGKANAMARISAALDVMMAAAGSQ